MPFYDRTVSSFKATAVENNDITAEQESTPTPILIPGYSSRITKKPFGIYVDAHNSPVTPERFKGYHTGIDLEITDDEVIRDIPVCAMCDGEVAVARWMSGYGGVLVQRCTLSAHGSVTIIYGHLMPGDNLNNMSGRTIYRGEKIGVLGKQYSQETDGERKHLHLAIHKGTGITYAGYVDTEEKLAQWIDPCDVIVCQK